MEIRVRNNISDEESERLFGWGEDIFGSNHLNLRWKPKDLHIFVHVDGNAVTHVGLLQHTVTVGDEQVKVCGVGGVVTTLDEHGKGYATHAMRHAASLMREELRVDFGLLFCHGRLIPFYERLGWQRIKDAVEIEQPSGPITSPMNVLILPCGKESWPDGPVKLNSLPW
ncbi:MAG TPA: GNAT family N-acetyltransferase [Pyrinomonadaceae bacterium]|jgi:GNAT superfamily N-acetyltransferase